MTEGTEEAVAQNNIWMMDIDGLIVKDRPKGKILGMSHFNLMLFNFLFGFLCYECFL